MAKITYANKVALNENPEIADINKVKDTDMNQIKEVVNANEAKVLLEVSNIAPDTCSTGDMYFNTTTNLIYTATATNTWGSTGVAPTSNTMYVTFSDKTIYMYNGTTLISVGGGAGGGGDNEPIGKVVPMVLETAPDGYILCDGSTYTKAAYPDLYKALVGTQFIIDTNSFTVPNLKGKVIVGLDSTDTDFDNIGDTGGSKYLQAHSHGIKNYVSVNSGTTNGLLQETNKISYGYLETDVAGTGHSGNLQPYIVLNYFIKAQKTSGDVILSESLPVGTIVDFDGSASDIPVGWEAYGTGQIKKVAPTTSIQAQVVNTYNTSDSDTYSCDYINNSESYSTSEVKTNKTWFGKPVYRKMLIINQLPNTGSYQWSIGVANLDLAKINYGESYMTWIAPRTYPIIRVNPQIDFIIDNNNNLEVITYDNSYVNWTAYVVIEYTKTTDNTNTRNLQESKKSIEEEPIEEKK